MLARVCSAAVKPAKQPVEVEVNAGYGTIIIVGPDAAVKESRDRVSTAQSSGSDFRGRCTINLHRRM
jgi:predicted ATPase with chaperone activity